MFRWVRQYKEANSQTKYFILNWILYGLMLIASTIYVYIRLDYVRSGHQASPKAVHSTLQK